MLEIDEFDPKRHPKSLVSTLSTCRTKYSVYTIYQLFADVMHLLNILLPPRLVDTQCQSMKEKNLLTK